MIVNEQAQASSISEQLLKLEHDTDMTAASDFATAQMWERLNTWLGLSIIVLSGIATILGAISSEGVKRPSAGLLIASIIISATVAVVGSVLTFLKPAERASLYREFGNKQKSLRNRIRVFRTVSINFEADLKAQHSKLETFILDKDSLNSDNPPIARWAFRRATKDIEEKVRRRSRTQLPPPTA